MRHPKRSAFVTVSDDGIRYVRTTTESSIYNMMEEKGDATTLWLVPWAFFEMLLVVARVEESKTNASMERMKQVLRKNGIISRPSKPITEVFHRFDNKPTFPIRFNEESIFRTHYTWWEYLVPVDHFLEESIRYFESSGIPACIADFPESFRSAFLEKFGN